jgi:hypothetical protein
VTVCENLWWTSRGTRVKHGKIRHPCAHVCTAVLLQFCLLRSHSHLSHFWLAGVRWQYHFTVGIRAERLCTAGEIAYFVILKFY